MTILNELNSWTEKVSQLTMPEKVHWCDGTKSEYDHLVEKMLNTGDLIELDQKNYPDCFLHRSNPSDVARVEHLTYVCTTDKNDAGPNNNWMKPEDAHQLLDKHFHKCMQKRTMYVIPYCMGPLNSPYARCGIEITDSPYVAINMHIMTRVGDKVLKLIEKQNEFVKGLHSIGQLDPNQRYIMHFPEEKLIKSFGSGYGGNALLGKKCHALRIASWQAREQGWLAEHMLILGVEDPEGHTTYIAAAFPSACGKTNLAMLIPPKLYQDKGYKVWTVGDDIAWMHLGEDGQLWAINPEAGFFGVAPGTSEKTNPNALEMLKHDTIFTNVALSKDKNPWWEGLTQQVPDGLIDWKGNLHNPAQGPAAHPNSRFTVSAKQCRSYSPKAEDPQGVPISAIIFGGRRKTTAPLVFQATNWAHGTLVGAAVASETTAAATGQVGVVRRDSMAMKPFCGYNFADYWQHWLSFGKKSDKLPKIFHVNWFRQDDRGKYLWPGFGDNLRVLCWIIDRCRGKGEANLTPIGYLPKVNSINTEGLDLSEQTMKELIKVDPLLWKREFEDIGNFLKSFGERIPKELWAEHERILKELG